MEKHYYTHFVRLVPSFGVIKLFDRIIRSFYRNAVWNIYVMFQENYDGGYSRTTYGVINNFVGAIRLLIYRAHRTTDEAISRIFHWVISTTINVIIRNFVGVISRVFYMVIRIFKELSVIPFMESLKLIRVIF